MGNRSLLGSISLVYLGIIAERGARGQSQRAFSASHSSGQKQRVAVARASMLDPRLMLFDEATPALDPQLVTEVEQVILGPAAQGMPMMIVTHDMWLAKDVASPSASSAYPDVRGRGCRVRPSGQVAPRGRGTGLFYSRYPQAVMRSTYQVAKLSNCPSVKREYGPGW